MKRLLTLFACVAVAAFAFTSCEDEPANADVALEGITVSPTTLSLKVGETGNLTAAYKPEDATVKPEIEWSSSDPRVASVDARGAVKALAAGSAEIVAKADKFTAKCAVTVTADDPGPGPQPEDKWDYTPGAAYADATNLWKPVFDANGEKYFYYFCSGADWNGTEVETTDVPFLTKRESTYKIHIENATTQYWQNQFFVFPNEGHEVALSSARKYKVQITFGASANTRGFVKLLQYKPEGPKHEGALIYEVGNFDLVADVPNVIEFPEIKGVDCANIIFVMDFGRSPANTDVFIKDVIVADAGEFVPDPDGVFVNDVALVEDANGTLSAKVNFTKDGVVAIRGIENLEGAWNRDFFSMEDGSLKFIRESGEYDVVYSEEYNYLWIAKLNAVAPECLWVVGHGFTQATSWNESLSHDGWMLGPITRVGYAVPIGDNKYQCSLYLTNNHDWGKFEFEVYSNLTWGKDNGFCGTSITGDSAGMHLGPAADKMPGLQGDEEGFVEGYFRLIFDNATGEINVTRLSGEGPVAETWDYTPSAAYLSDGNLWKPLFDGNFDYVFGQITGYEVVDITACPSIEKKESTYKWTFAGATEGEWGCCNFLAPLADHPVALKAGSKYQLKVTIGATAPIAKFIFSLHTYKADADNREGAWLTDMWGEIPANTPVTFTQEYTPTDDLENIAWTIIPQFGTPAGMVLYIKDLVVEEVIPGSGIPDYDPITGFEL